MTKFTQSAALLVCFVCGPLAAQTTMSLVSSSYPTPIKSFDSTAFYSLTIQVAYPINLSPGSYVSATQLGNDVLGFNNAYPNAGDPPEAILFSIQAILAKYPQMTGGSLPIGKTSTLGGLFSGQSVSPAPASVK